eukprot:XP_001703663.1 predicted protein [Chlamydomonas reinhardtii]
MDRSGFTRRHGQSCLLGQWTGSCRPNSVVCQAAASWSASGPSVIGAGASSDGDAQTSSSPAAGAAADSPPAQWHDGDVLELTLADGRSVYAEVEVPGAGAGAVTASVSVAAVAGASAPANFSPHVICNGARYKLEAHEGQAAWVLRATSGALAAGDPLLALMATPPKPHTAALRAWAPLASQLLRPPAGAAPAAPGSVDVTAPSASSSPPAPGRRVAPELQQQVADNPSLWCDGSGPGEPPLTPDQLALYTAAELACLAAGRRGVVLLQLHVGWQQAAAAPPYGPFKPLVLRLLRQLLASPGKELQLVSFASAAPDPSSPGGKSSAGLTMVLCADKEPFRSWGAHLAGFGCQAALEAQSPYYKALIGRVLGYSPDNIAHHIREKHGAPPSSEVLAAVERQLGALSTKQPQLPWTAGARGSRKKAAA